MHNRISSALRGLPVLDLDGRPAGTVLSTYPFDGCTPEFALVRVGRFGSRVLVPLVGSARTDDALRVPFDRAALEDAPSLDNVRYLDDAVSRTRGYWTMVDQGTSVRLPYLPLARA
jgi:hypothetical protein